MMMAGTALGGFIGYIFHFIVSRQMSIAQYGELQSLLSASIIFGVLNSALSYFAIRHTSVFAAHNDQAANQEFIDYFSPKIFKIAAILLLALLILSPALSTLLHFSSYLGFFVISVATFISTMTIIYSEVLRGWQDFIALSLIGIIMAVVKMATGSGLSFVSHKASVVSFSILLSAISGWLITKRWSRKKTTGSISEGNPANRKEKYFSEASTKKTAIYIFFFSLALILVSNLDVILVKYFSSAETTGYYGAFSLIGKIILWFNLVVVGVMLPGACVDGYGGKRLGKKNLLESYGLMTILAFGLILLYYLIPNFIVNLFFGEKYIIDTQILWIFGVMSYLLSILTLEANLSFAKHDFRVIYFLALTVLLMVAGLAKYHSNLEEIALALSASFLVGYLSVTIFNLSHEKKRLKATNSW